MIFKKILSIFIKMVLGLFALYLFFALALIPLFAPIIIKSQGSKILKTPVGVRGVYINPLYCSLHVVGLDVKNNSGEKLLGLDRLRIDVSFRSFLKKMLHIEVVELDGLFIHATLLPDGRIDLLGLVPASESSTTPVNSAAPVEKKSLPLIIIDKITVQDGRIRFDDRTVHPIFSTTFYQMELNVSGFSTKSDSVTDVDFKTFLDGKGAVTVQARVKPMQRPLDMEFNLKLDQYALTTTNPYIGKYTGRHLAEGRMNFNAVYRISDNKLNARHNLLIQNFTFGEKVESKDAFNLPFGFAVALLEDPQGRIKISLPVEGDLNDPQFRYSRLIGQTIRNFFMKLVTKPFLVLGSMIAADAGTEELGLIYFIPGKAQLAPEQEEKLITLTDAMKDRPRLLLEIHGSYDLTSDWKNLKVEQFNKDYAALKKETSKDENWVLQTLYQRRFGIRQLWKLTKAFKTPQGYRYDDLNNEIRRHLGEDAFADKVALHELADARAKIVYEIILKEHLDPRRVQIGNNHQVQGSLGLVPMNFTLTVFDEPNQ